MRNYTPFRLVITLLLTTTALLGYAETGFVDSNGTKIHYQSAGQGEPVILIHGFTANATLNWIAPGIYKDLAKDHHVIAIDARGHGKSDKPHGAENYGTKMVDDIVNVMDALEIDRAHIVGYSMGGFLTTKFTIEYPERVISAMPSAAGWLDPDSDETDNTNTIAESLENGNGLAPLFEQLNPEGAPKPTPEYIATLNKMLLATNDPLALAGAARGMADLSVTADQLKQNEIPITAIVGSKDPLALGVHAMEQHTSNLKAIYIDGRDHMSLLNDKQYLQAIRKHITTHSLAERS